MIIRIREYCKKPICFSMAVPLDLEYRGKDKKKK